MGSSLYQTKKAVLHFELSAIDHGNSEMTGREQGEGTGEGEVGGKQGQGGGGRGETGTELGLLSQRDDTAVVNQIFETRFHGLCFHL